MLSGKSLRNLTLHLSALTVHYLDTTHLKLVMEAFHHTPHRSGTLVYISYLAGDWLKEERAREESVGSSSVFSLRLHRDER